MANMLKFIRKSSDAAHVRKTESITIYIDGSNISCTTISVYENLSKNSFLYCVGKPTPPVCRSCSRFASAKVRLFLKPAKKQKRFFKKIVKNKSRKDIFEKKMQSIPYI